MNTNSKVMHHRAEESKSIICFIQNITKFADFRNQRRKIFEQIYEKYPQFLNFPHGNNSSLLEFNARFDNFCMSLFLTYTNGVGRTLASDSK